MAGGHPASASDRLGERDARLSHLCGRSWPEGVLLDALNLSPALDVLDVGAGDGRLVRELARRGHAGRVVGISKLARVVDTFARRLQIQEKMTAQIANSIADVLQPHGVAVVVEASHQCMTTRGVHKTGVTMVTSRLLGVFRDNPSTRREFLDLIGNPVSRPG